MVELKVKPRPVGATAVLGRIGHPQVTSDTQGEVNVVTGASEVGFNPLDLMFSSLATCLVLSARIAASKLGILTRLSEVKVHVTGEKAHDGPSRITHFIIDIKVEGDYLPEEKAEIIVMAEEICTISNTLKGSPEFSLQLP